MIVAEYNIVDGTQKLKHPNKSWIEYPATKIISLVFQCKTVSMRKLQ